MGKFNGTSYSDLPDELKGDRECTVCGTLFKPRSGVNKFCSAECKGKWQYITGRLSTENQYKSISGNWERYFQRLVNQKGRKEDGLTSETLLELLDEQDKKCALTGIELTCILEKGTVCKTNASIDRLDAGGPYIKENIQLVCRSVNSFRNNTTVDEFIWWCKQVANHNNN